MTGTTFDSKTCIAKGLPAMRGKLLRLEGLEASLNLSLIDLEKERDHAKLINGSLFALKVIKASCDAFFETLASVAPQHQGAASLYSTATDLAGIGGKAMAGADFRQDAAKFLSKKTVGAGFAKAGKGIDGAAQKTLEASGKLGEVKSDLVIDAMAKDEKSIKEDLANYGFEFTKLVAEAGKESGAWKGTKLVPAIGVGHAFYKAGSAFSGAYDDMKKEGVDANFDAQKRTLINSLRTVRSKISVLRSTLSACGVLEPAPDLSHRNLRTTFPQHNGPQLRQGR